MVKNLGEGEQSAGNAGGYSHGAGVRPASRPSNANATTPENRRLDGRLGFEEIAPIRGIRGASPMAMLRPPASVRHAVPARAV